MKFSQSEYERTKAALELSQQRRSDCIRLNVSSDERLEAALEAEKCAAAFHASFGWHEIEDKEEWTRLRETFASEFFPDQSELRCPAPFAIWDVDHILDSSLSQLLSFQRDIHDKCIAALKRTKLNSWYVLENIHHPWYRLKVDEMPDHIEDWPVELLPCGDPCYLLSEDLSCGIIMQVRGPISIFGEPFFSAIKEDLPLAFTLAIKKSPDQE